MLRVAYILLLGVAGVFGQERVQVRILAEVVSLPQVDAVALVREHIRQPNANALRAELQKRIAAGGAALEASMMGLSESGRRAQSSAGGEKIYPIEWSCAEVVHEIHGTIKGSPRLTTNATPTSFDTIGLGMRLDIAPMVSEDRTLVDLNIAYTHRTQHGRIVTGEDEGRTEHPRIYREGVSTAVTIGDGQWVLAAMTTPRDSDVRHLLLLSASVLGEKKGAPPSSSPPRPWQTLPHLGILTEYVEVSLDDAVELGGLVKFRENLDALLAGGKARWVETAYVVTRSGQRARVESVEEMIYPIEMGCPPGVPFEITGTISKEVRLRSAQGYTSYETRNVGLTMEVDPVLGSDGVTMDFNIAPEIVRFLGMRTFGEVPQPVFSTQRTSTAATVWDGRSIMVGMGASIDPKTWRPDPAKRVLTIVTAGKQEVGK